MIPTKLKAQLRNFAVGVHVTLYELDTTPLGGQVYYFTNQVFEERVPIKFGGKTYTQIACDMSKVDIDAQGAPATPNFSIATLGGPMAALIQQYKDLKRCKVRRYVTFAEYLDLMPAPSLVEGEIYGETEFTNELVWSQRMDNAAWLKNNQTVAANSTTAPDGTVTADTLTRSANAGSYTRQVCNVVAGQTRTLSVFAKAKSVGGRIGLRVQGTYPDRVDAVFDLNAGTLVGTVAANYTVLDATIVPVVNGWYRLTLTCKVAGTPATLAMFGPTDASKTVGGWEGASATLSNCYVWQGQLVPGTAPGPVILTEAAPYTSNHGLVTNPNADGSAKIKEELYVINRKTSADDVFAEFELKSPVDMEGVQLPLRIVRKRWCDAKYRVPDGNGGFIYFPVEDGGCPFKGGAYFDVNGNPTTADKDRCSKEVETGCVKRFGKNQALPFSALPGVRGVQEA